MAKRQLTLAHWTGFKKQVSHNGKLVDVSVPTTVEESYTKLHVCDFCDKRFEAKKGLTSHMYMCASKSQSSTQKTLDESIATNKMNNVTHDPKNSDIEEVESVPASASSKNQRSKRRGKDRRNKYTAIMKSNVIDEYENGATQDQLEEKYNINRSLVSKWSSEKERAKIRKAATSEYKNHTKI